MTPEKAAALAAIHAACFSTPRPWGADEIAALADGAGTFTLSRQCGFAMGRAVAGEAELLTLAVLPEARRNGLGRALLHEFLAKAGARDAQTAYLEVAADNDAAIALYLGAGFVETGRRGGYYARSPGRPVDAVILSRNLGGNCRES